MIITEQAVAGVLLIQPEPQRDERGYFARLYDRKLLAARGLIFTLCESSTSYNFQRGTLRGLHYQAAPAAETKLVRCTQGSIFDVVVDLRRTSPTYRQWVSSELTAENLRGFVIPVGCAHGFMTLADRTEVAYHIDAAYTPRLARGVRWNDPTFSITWPMEPTVISARDAAYPDFDPEQAF